MTRDSVDAVHTVTVGEKRNKKKRGKQASRGKRQAMAAAAARAE
jgi:hypothetical protein